MVWHPAEMRPGGEPFSSDLACGYPNRWWGVVVACLRLLNCEFGFMGGFVSLSAETETAAIKQLFATQKPDQHAVGYLAQPDAIITACDNQFEELIEILNVSSIRLC